MKISHEHKLALKISLILLIIFFGISNIFQYLNQFWIIDFSWNRWNNKYIIFIISSVIIYFVSLKLAFLTTKPIKETAKKLKNYNHNLAHELKNPLAVLKTNLELLEISYDKNLIKSSFEEIISMENIINSLLFLSENSKNRINEKISLSQLLWKYTKNENISINIINDFKILWDKNLFEILLKNIIENWLKYSSDKKINIKLKKNEIIFKNNINKNIDENELNNLFDIFYKWQNSNSLWSYWIWLSIVKKICETHDLKINLESRSNFFQVAIKKV